MERRCFLGCLLGLSVAGCAERGGSSTRTPTTSTFGVYPVSEPEEGRTGVEIVTFGDLTAEEQGFLAELLPAGGIECESRSDGWDSLIGSLPSGDSVYLERDDDLYALYVSRADEVFITSADYGEFPIDECEADATMELFRTFLHR